MATKGLDLQPGVRCVVPGATGKVVGFRDVTTPEGMALYVVVDLGGPIGLYPPDMVEEAPLAPQPAVDEEGL